LKSQYEIEEIKREKAAKHELLSIINKTTLSPKKLWEITDDNFYTWVRKHYYPKLLQHFRDNFYKFDEWQRTWFLPDQRIMELGITQCLEAKYENKNPYKYIIQRITKNLSTEFVSDDNIDGKNETSKGPYFSCRHKKIDSFVPYLEWISIQGYYPSEHIRYYCLLT